MHIGPELLTPDIMTGAGYVGDLKMQYTFSQLSHIIIRQCGTQPMVSSDE